MPAFGTLSTTDKSSDVTLSNGNLTATNSAVINGHNSVRATNFITMASQKVYFEVTVGARGASTSSRPGVANSTFALTGQAIGDNANGIGIGDSGNVRYNGVIQCNIGTNVPGDVICIAIDGPNAGFYARKGASGNWNGSGTANPATNTGKVAIAVVGDLAPATNLYNPSDAMTFNFGQSTYVGAVPSGYINLNNGAASGGGAAAPTGVTASAVSSSSISLNWNDNAEATLSYYAVRRSSDSSNPATGTWTRLAPNFSTSDAVDTGLTASTQYWYYVTAVLSDGTVSPNSSVVTATTPAAAGGTVTFDSNLESGTLNAFDSIIRAATDRATIVDDPILGAARKVLKVRVKDADVAPLTPTDNPRVQFESPYIIPVTNGTHVWYGESMLWPLSGQGGSDVVRWPDIPASPSQYTVNGVATDVFCVFGSVYGPPFSGSSENLLRMNSLASIGHKLYSEPVTRGIWYDFAHHIVMGTSSATGLYELWRDKGDGFEQIINNPQATVTSANNGGNNNVRWSQYRVKTMWSDTTYPNGVTVFFAEMRIGTSFDAVKPHSYDVVIPPPAAEVLEHQDFRRSSLFRRR